MGSQRRGHRPMDSFVSCRGTGPNNVLFFAPSQTNLSSLASRNFKIAQRRNAVFTAKTEGRATRAQHSRFDFTVEIIRKQAVLSHVPKR